ncbi:MAG TPA: hypothetical protein DDY04_01345 [Bacteroidales bacterium]|nr:hypothetical protein [Bacteroidales bacterium]
MLIAVCFLKLVYAKLLRIVYFNHKCFKRFSCFSALLKNMFVRISLVNSFFEVIGKEKLKVKS